MVSVRLLMAPATWVVLVAAALADTLLLAALAVQALSVHQLHLQRVLVVEAVEEESLEEAVEVLDCLD